MKQIARLSMIIGAALALLAACTKEPLPELNNNSEQGLKPITFTSNTLEVESRALICHIDFVVLAIIEYPEVRTFTEERYKIVDGERVLTTETVKSKYGWYFSELYVGGKPKSGNTHYWPIDGSTLSFYAFSSDYLDIVINSGIDPDAPLTAAQLSRINIQDIANINKVYSAETLLNKVKTNNDLFAIAVMPEDDQEELTVATPHLDVIYGINEEPQPVELEFNHQTAKVNINVRLDDELDKKYNINDDYYGVISANMNCYYVNPFTDDVSKWVRIVNHGNQRCSGGRSYNVLPQLIVGEGTFWDRVGDVISTDNPYTGEVWLGIENLYITDDAGNSFNPKFNYTVEKCTLQAGDIEGDALKAGVEYTFTLVLHSLDLDSEGNIPFDRKKIFIEASKKDWLPGGKKTFDQPILIM